MLFFPLIVHVQSSTFPPLLVRSSCKALAVKASVVLRPITYTLQQKKLNPLDKSFYAHRHMVLFFFLNKKVWSQNWVPDLIYSNYLTTNPSAILKRATESSSSNIYTYIQIYTIHSRRHKLRFQLI